MAYSLAAALLALPTYPVLAMGLVAWALLCLWGFSWLLSLRWLGFYDVTNRELLYLAIALGGLGAVAFAVRERLLQRAVQSILKFPALGLGHMGQRQARGGAERFSFTDQTKSLDRDEQTQTYEQSAMALLPMLALMWLFMPVMFVIVMFTIRAVLYLWDPELANMLGVDLVVWAGVGLGFMYTAAISSLTWSLYFLSESQRIKTWVWLALWPRSSSLGVHCRLLFGQNISKSESIMGWRKTRASYKLDR